MMVMCCILTFPDADRVNGKTLIIRSANDIHIEAELKTLTKSAVITLPRNVKKLFDKYKVPDIWRRGDRVKIELGYDNDMVTEFEGYISQGVSADIPIKIQCQDEMWKLKQLPVNYSATGATLKSVLNAICKGYQVDALDGVQLGTVRFSKTTVAAVLDKLASDWKLYTYMDGKTLVCGRYYQRHSDETPVKFNLDRNVVDNTLNYKNKADIVLKLTADSILVNGRKLSVVLGQDGGDQMTLTYYNVKIKADLESKAKVDYERAVQGGFDGSFTAFGRPYVALFGKVELSSATYADRKGTYWAEGITVDWNNNGYRRKIKSGGQVGTG